MNDQRPSDFAIDEFRALRDEIKRCESESLSVTLYAFTAVVLAAGLAEKTGQTILAAPILIQVALLWAMNRHNALNALRRRLSTYIQVMLEPVLPGIRWEGRNVKFESAYRPIQYCLSPVMNRWLHKLTQVFPLLLLIGVYVSISTVGQIQTRGFWFYVFVVVLAVLHLMSIPLVDRCVFRPILEPYFEARWKDVKQSEPERTAP